MSEVPYCMEAKPGQERKVTSAELLEQTCKWYGGCIMSALERENHQKSYKIGWVLPI